MNFQKRGTLQHSNILMMNVVISYGSNCIVTKSLGRNLHFFDLKTRELILDLEMEIDVHYFSIEERKNEDYLVYGSTCGKIGKYSMRNLLKKHISSVWEIKKRSCTLDVSSKYSLVFVIGTDSIWILNSESGTIVSTFNLDWGFDQWKSCLFDEHRMALIHTLSFQRQLELIYFDDGFTEISKTDTVTSGLYSLESMCIDQASGNLIVSGDSDRSGYAIEFFREDSGIGTRHTTQYAGAMCIDRNTGSMYLVGSPSPVVIYS